MCNTLCTCLSYMKILNYHFKYYQNSINICRNLKLNVSLQLQRLKRSAYHVGSVQS